jgi:hypothetical protein
MKPTTNSLPGERAALPGAPDQAFLGACAARYGVSSEVLSTLLQAERAVDFGRGVLPTTETFLPLQRVFRTKPA